MRQLQIGSGKVTVISLFIIVVLSVVGVITALSAADGQRAGGVQAISNEGLK